MEKERTKIAVRNHEIFASPARSNSILTDRYQSAPIRRSSWPDALNKQVAVLLPHTKNDPNAGELPVDTCDDLS
eukprot:768607-Hanusia_phi.AAC.12